MGFCEHAFFAYYTIFTRNTQKHQGEATSAPSTCVRRETMQTTDRERETAGDIGGASRTPTPRENMRGRLTALSGIYAERGPRRAGSRATNQARAAKPAKPLEMHEEPRATRPAQAHAQRRRVFEPGATARWILGSQIARSLQSVCSSSRLWGQAPPPTA